MTDVAAHLALAGTSWLAEEPTTWDQGSEMSLLTALLVFFIGPIVIIAIIVLLVMSPSLAKGPRYRPGADGEVANATEWFGAVPGEDDRDRLPGTPQRQLATAAADERLSDEDTGGASARW